MKKILAILMASAFIFTAASCGSKDEVNDLPDDAAKQENAGGDLQNGSDADQPVQSEPGETEAENNGTDPEVNAADGSNSDTLKAMSSEEFTGIISLSMAPYRQTPVADANMTVAVTGYNGKVELTHYSFGTAEAAAAYFESSVEKYPGETLVSEAAENYALCRKQDSEGAYMLARIDNTILFGFGKNGFEELDDWFYGLGYIAEK